MALNLVLRRAAASTYSVLSRAICSIWPLPRISSKVMSDETPIRGVIQPETIRVEEFTEEVVSDGFPFEIKYNPAKKSLLLTRRCGPSDACFKVEVMIDYSDSYSHHVEAEADVKLFVSISFQTHTRLEYELTAFPSEITFDRIMLFNYMPHSSDITDLGDDLPLRHLRCGEINLSTMNLLHEYLINNDSTKDYLRYPNNLRKLIAQYRLKNGRGN